MRLHKGIKLLGQGSPPERVRKNRKGISKLASIMRVGELGSEGMVNESELLINVVKSNKPTNAIRLEPKGNVAGFPCEFWGYANNRATGEEARPNPILVLV
ncbi:hypothetical protein D0T84_11220 [Dysgonomonas sp. 521]|nr:hypothetical protein [Dysgonomonas sp. 521]